MNNTAPTFAKQDSLKIFRTLNSQANSYLKKTTFRKQEIETIPKKQ
jgi:linoleoyl-CoA desaturase